jgi:hypothetical protein
MTKDEIIRMAQEAGFRVNTTESLLEELERFAKLVEERTLKQLNTEETT